MRFAQILPAGVGIPGQGAQFVQELMKAAAAGLTSLVVGFGGAVFGADLDILQHAAVSVAAGAFG